MKVLTPYGFFKRHAGYSIAPGETKEEGRKRSAMTLAHAERIAEQRGYTFSWERDDIYSDEWKEDHEDGGKHNQPWGTWLCVMHDKSGRVVSSLGAIDFGRDGSPWNSTYKRVVEAELASELEMRKGE